MATSKLLPLLLLVSLSTTTTTTARPCNTLFFFTSSSFFYPSSNPNPNPNNYLSNPDPNNYPSLSPRFLTFFFTTTTTPPLRHLDINFRLNNKPSIFLGRNPIFFDRIAEEDQLVVERQGEEEEDVSKRSIASMFRSSSIGDRTKDIMRVMGAMLFGAGCGALTAAIMYLIWSLFWPTAFDFEDSDDDFDYDHDVVSPKKMGYVVLPTKVVDDDDLKKPAKEVV